MGDLLGIREKHSKGDEDKIVREGYEYIEVSEDIR